MSAEEMYSEHGATGRQIDDPYLTRPLPLHEITDHPADFLDLVQELRETKASSYTLRDTPMFTCRQRNLSECLAALG